MHAIRLFFLYLRLGVQNELQYRANFLVQCLTSVAEVGGVLWELSIVFAQTPTLGGWHQEELRALVGVFFIVGGTIHVVIGPSMTKLMEDVRLGTLDYAILKPEDAQLLVSLRQFDVWKFLDVLLGAGILTEALWRLGERVTLAHAGAFVLALFCGIVVVYCFWLMLATCTFWFVKMDNILYIFQAVYDAGRWPLSIYPAWLRLMLTLLVPVAFAVTVPAEALVGRLQPAMLWASVGLATAMVVISRWFWLIGIRHYSGASA